MKKNNLEEDPKKMMEDPKNKKKIMNKNDFASWEVLFLFKTIVHLLFTSPLISYVPLLSCKRTFT